MAWLFFLFYINGRRENVHRIPSFKPLFILRCPAVNLLVIACSASVTFWRLALQMNRLCVSFTLNAVILARVAGQRYAASYLGTVPPEFLMVIDV